MTQNSAGQVAGQIQAAYARALRLQEAGRFAEAVKIHTAILQHREVAEPSFQIGRIAAMTGRKADAATWFQRALKVKPKQPEIWQALIEVLEGKDRTAALNKARKLGVVLSERNARQLRTAVDEIAAGRLKKAARLFEAAIADGAEAQDARSRWATALLAHGHVEDALSVANDGLAANPDDATLLQLRASLHEVLGNLDAAEDDLGALLALQPYHAIAWNSLMRLRRQPKDDPKVSRLERLIGEAEGDPDAVRVMSFGLAKGLEDQGRYDEAFTHLERANRMTAQKFPHNGKEHLDWVRDLIGAWTPRDDGFEDAAPIFVVGLPRSGTSLVETILARHPLVAPASEASIMTPILKPALETWRKDGVPYDARALGQAYVEGMAKKLGAAGEGRRSTDKSIMTYA